MVLQWWQSDAIVKYPVWGAIKKKGVNYGYKQRIVHGCGWDCRGLQCEYCQRLRWLQNPVIGGYLE